MNKHYATQQFPFLCFLTWCHRNKLVSMENCRKPLIGVLDHLVYALSHKHTWDSIDMFYLVYVYLDYMFCIQINFAEQFFPFLSRIQIHNFNFRITNFPQIRSTIPTTPAYEIYISLTHSVSKSLLRIKTKKSSVSYQNVDEPGLSQITSCPLQKK